jgi:riboflavin synthase
VIRVGVPTDLLRYLAPQGSVALDGVSLTVVDVTDPVEAGGSAPGFTVSLIPETLARTTLGTAPVGARLNLEVDVLAKYVERMLRWNASNRTGREVAA